jgi:hypothetical protein
MWLNPYEVSGYLLYWALNTDLQKAAGLRSPQQSLKYPLIQIRHRIDPCPKSFDTTDFRANM